MNRTHPMLIDFLTYYHESTYESMCQRALDIGIDGLVMAGAPQHTKGPLQVFPAQLAPWVATVEWNDDRERGQFIRRGNLLAILPEGKQLYHEEKPLLELLDEIKAAGGVSVGLYTTRMEEIRHLIDNSEYSYPFDAIQIKAGESFNVHFLNRPSRHMVAGSAAADSEPRPP